MADHPGVKIELSPTPGKGEGETLSAQWSAGRTNTDLVMGGSRSDVAIYVAPNLLVEFDDNNFFNGEFARPQFIEALLKEGRFANSKQFAIPIIGEVMYTVIRKDWFQEAGLLGADGKAIPPKDWNQWKDYAKALTNKDNRITLGVNWNPVFMWLTYLSHILASKKDLYESKGSSMVDFQSEQAEGILQFWQDIVPANYCPTTTFSDVNALRNGFKSGMVAAFIEPHSRWPECEVAVEKDGVDRVSVMPILANARALAYGHTVYIPKLSPVPDLAIAFIKEQLMSAYGQQWSADRFGKMPVLARNFAGLKAPEWKEILEAAAIGDHEPNYRDGPKLNELLQVEMEKGITKAQTVKETLKNLRDGLGELDLSLV